MEHQTRLIFLDNLRILLVLLVVAHHTGQAYGPTGGWWPYQEAARSLYLGLLFVVNRSFFMSLFFLIAGYFTPASFDHKGPGEFLTDRFRRFGIPLLFFICLIIPVLHYAYFLSFRPYGKIPFWNYYTGYYLGHGAKPADWTGPAWPEANFGHLWFIEHLLLFALVYSLLRPIRRRFFGNPSAAPPGHKQIIFLTLGIAVLSFTVRIWYPIDRWIALLRFIQVAPADLPRDLGWFIVGTAAYRHNWLLTIKRKTGRVWLNVGLAMIALAAAKGMCNLLGWLPSIPWTSGGFPMTSLIYALWESLLCSGMCIGLPVLFRERLNLQNRLARALAQNSYGVYLFHVPVVVALQYAAGRILLGPMPKFLLVTAVAVLITFSIVQKLRNVPLFRNIL